MLNFIKNGSIVMVENDEGQIQIITEEEKKEFEKAKQELLNTKPIVENEEE